MLDSNKRTETDWVEWLAARAPKAAGVELGIGDDGAVLAPPGGSRLVFASDQVVEGVHFLPEAPPELVGRKALARNLSDLAAMSARPWAAVVSAMLPRDRPARSHERLFEGLFQLAHRFGMAVVGGDLAAVPDRLALDVAVLGLLDGRAPFVRSGARPGDAIAVTGELGGSILGRHLEFEPRVVEALALARDYTVSAAIDVSDGLLLDLERVARSSGLRAQLDLERIPVSRAAIELAASRGGTPLDHALTDGEDYELLVVMAPSEVERVIARRPFDTPFTVIGRMLAGEPGVSDATGRELTRPGAGYQHEL